MKARTTTAAVIALVALVGGRLRRRVGLQGLAPPAGAPAARAPASSRSSPTRRRRSSTTRSSRPSRRPPAGKGVHVQAVLRRLGRPEPRGRGRPARRRRHLLARARRRPPRQGRASSRRLGQTTPTNGFVTTRVVVLHRPQGQPQAHQDLGRPAQARRPGRHARTRSPRARPSGTCWPPTARATGRRPVGYVQSAHQARQGPAEVRPRGAADLHLGHRRRPALLRERGDHRPEEGPGRRLRRSRTRRSRSRTRSRCRRSRKSPTQAKAFLDYACPSPAQEVFAELGLPPGRPVRARRPTSKFPTPSGLFTIDDIGGWDKINDDLFDPATGAVAKIEQSAGVSTAK